MSFNTMDMTAEDLGMSTKGSEHIDCDYDGQDIAIFYGREDLVEKAKYYAAHDSQREIIAARGARKVAEQHTVGQRIRKLLETLKTAL